MPQIGEKMWFFEYRYDDFIAQVPCESEAEAIEESSGDEWKKGAEDFAIVLKRFWSPNPGKCKPSEYYWMPDSECKPLEQDRKPCSKCGDAGVVGFYTGDNEPVSEERLTALLGNARPGYGWKLSYSLSIWNSRNGFGVYFTGGEGDTDPVRLFSLATMKDIRHLCQAIGTPTDVNHAN